MIVAILSIACVPRGDVIEDRFHLIELNHYFCENGKHVFDQLIFLDFNEHESRFDCHAWVFAKQDSQRPRYDYARRLWSCNWRDGDGMRHVYGASFRESWTQYDPECEQRKEFPVDQRRGLSR